MNRSTKAILISVSLVAMALAIIQAPCFAVEIEQQEFFVNADTGMKLMVVAKIPQSGRIGQAVLLVHGSGVGWEYWDVPFRDYSIMDYLARKGIDVYAVECRGYGKSTKPNGLEVASTSIAADLRTVVTDITKRSKVEKVSIVGHSSGGKVLMAVAGTYPELLNKIVFMGTSYKKRNPKFIPYATKVLEEAKQPGRDYVTNSHHLDVEKRLDTYDEDVVLWYKKLVGENYSLMPAGVFIDSVENPASKFVTAIKVPSLFPNGSNEYVVDTDDALDLFKDIGASDKAMIIQPGGYHLMFLEKRGHVGIQESIFFWLTKK